MFPRTSNSRTAPARLVSSHRVISRHPVDSDFHKLPQHPLVIYHHSYPRPHPHRPSLHLPSRASATGLLTPSPSALNITDLNYSPCDSKQTALPVLTSRSLGRVNSQLAHPLVIRSHTFSGLPTELEEEEEIEDSADRYLHTPLRDPLRVHPVEDCHCRPTTMASPHQRASYQHIHPAPTPGRPTTGRPHSNSVPSQSRASLGQLSPLQNQKGAAYFQRAGVSGPKVDEVPTPKPCRPSVPAPWELVHRATAPSHRIDARVQSPPAARRPGSRPPPPSATTHMSIMTNRSSGLSLPLSSYQVTEESESDLNPPTDELSALRLSVAERPLSTASTESELDVATPDDVSQFGLLADESVASNAHALHSIKLSDVDAILSLPSSLPPPRAPLPPTPHDQPLPPRPARSSALSCLSSLSDMQSVATARTSVSSIPSTQGSSYAGGSKRAHRPMQAPTPANGRVIGRPRSASVSVANVGRETGASPPIPPPLPPLPHPLTRGRASSDTFRRTPPLRPTQAPMPSLGLISPLAVSADVAPSPPPSPGRFIFTAQSPSPTGNNTTNTSMKIFSKVFAPGKSKSKSISKMPHGFQAYLQRSHLIMGNAGGGGGGQRSNSENFNHSQHHRKNQEQQQPLRSAFED